MRNMNRKGGAAVVAVLIVIIMVAVCSALMVVTGRKTIQNSRNIEAPMPDGYSDKETTPEETVSQEPVVEEPVVPEVKPSVLPQIANTYQTIDLKDATFATACLLDCQTNELLAGQKYDKKIYPASLTKLMTLLVAVEKNPDLKATYTFTDADIDPLIEENASRAGFEAGETVTVEDLLYASIAVSGADGTIGLANVTAGSEAAFVELMNQKVTELGLSDTHFVNASGLHNEQHYTTAQDMAAITKACLDDATCRKVMFAESYTTSETEQHEEGIELISIFHGRFGGYFIDIDGDGEGDADILGGKTGFTDEAMYTLSTVIDVDGKEYVCVVTKCDGDLIATEDTIMVFENYLPGAVGTVSEEEDDSSDSAETETTEDSNAA
ncbi:MAG: D-alanyl-D-alanine carboxypeptidase [Ruminococcus sp.]|nr:D-alanyl-D-alanine carboxypeptidase [Ruminococcus sp.]